MYSNTSDPPGYLELASFLASWVKNKLLLIHNNGLKTSSACFVLDNSLQIESTCVFSPLTRGWVNECYCELFGKVRVDPELKNCFLADVAFR